MGNAFSEEEIEKLRTANQKLRYRLRILKLATEKELEVGAIETGAAVVKTDHSDKIDIISLGAKMTASLGDQTPSKRETDSKPKDNDCCESISSLGMKGPMEINELIHSKSGNEGRPFIIQYKEGVGNFVVASRDIKPNEVNILERYPFCYSIVNGITFRLSLKIIQQF